MCGGLIFVTGAKPHVRSLNQENKRDTLVNAEEEKNMNMSKIGQSQLNGAFVVRLGSHIVQVRTPNPTMSDDARGTHELNTDREGIQIVIWSVQS